MSRLGVPSAAETSPDRPVAEPALGALHAAAGRRRHVGAAVPLSSTAQQRRLARLCASLVAVQRRRQNQD